MADERARRELHLVECQGCHHVFLNPQPGAKELAPFYDASYFVFADPLPDIDRSIATLRRGDRFNHALVVPGGRYLDIGCGLGAMVAGMQRLGREAHGVEPGAIAVERGRSMGLNIVRGLLHERARFKELSQSSSRASLLLFARQSRATAARFEVFQRDDNSVRSR